MYLLYVQLLNIQPLVFILSETTKNIIFCMGEKTSNGFACSKKMRELFKNLIRKDIFFTLIFFCFFKNKNMNIS